MSKFNKVVKEAMKAMPRRVVDATSNVMSAPSRAKSAILKDRYDEDTDILKKARKNPSLAKEAKQVKDRLTKKTIIPFKLR